ncbi:MAG TPA: glycyl-radical enzyme activating protein [bacterium]|nr:MAG: Benzylsuccinate synthase activating enzyme [bacterium ADurb.Bin236]HPI76669.1 glycyl-radical enzyme activating protein [bacterium]HPN92986.1 glycyl-radical enzyme activating protein [bacterium]
MNDCGVEIKGLIFDIQRYALYDGPGIRTTVFLKGCPLKCAWCHNPESQSAREEASYFGEKCAACGACVKACAAGALAMKKRAVVRDPRKCSACGACAAACETGAMEIIGRVATVAEIADAVEADRPFYDESGGGATVSGGEPTAQPDFLFALLEEFRKRGIHSAVETCGAFNNSLVSRLAELADLVLFDIKHPDPGILKELTGANLEVVERNLSNLIQLKGESALIARVPLIPGVNTDETSIEGAAVLLMRNGYRGLVHLMPYNSMAATKWQKIGRGGEYRNFGALEEDTIAKIVNQLREAGFKTFINR